MKRKQRLLVGVQWKENFNGKNLVKGYAKWFGVDLICSINELRMIGIEVSEEYEQQVRTSIEINQRTKKLRKEESKSQNQVDESFSEIIGYTSLGFPYGLDVVQEENLSEDDLPF